MVASASIDYDNLIMVREVVSGRREGEGVMVRGQEEGRRWEVGI